MDLNDLRSVVTLVLFLAFLGIVVGISPEDYLPFAPEGGPLAGIALQRHWEGKAFEVGGGTYDAPAQRPVDPGALLRSEPYTRDLPEGAKGWRILRTACP